MCINAPAETLLNPKINFEMMLIFFDVFTLKMIDIKPNAVKGLFGKYLDEVCLIPVWKIGDGLAGDLRSHYS